MNLKQKIGEFLIPRLPISREAFDILRYELKNIRINCYNRMNPFVWLKISRLQKKTNLSLNIGAGPFGEDGWVNIDLQRMKNISLVYDCRKSIPFKNDSVERIRCEHVLEHYDKKYEVPVFLKECHRVLKRKGVLRIVVPDLEKFLQAYCSNSIDAWNKLGFNPNDWGSAIYILNHVFRQNGEHKFGYDYVSIKNLLEPFGFEAIRKEYGISVDKNLENDLENHKRYSLYIDCIKI